MDSLTNLKTCSLIGVKSVSPALFLFFIVAKNFEAFCSNLVNSSSFQIAAVLTTSAIPLMNSLSGKVDKKVKSTKTYCGCQKLPMKFLPNGVSTAVLPPIEESTIASKVVGT